MSATAGSDRYRGSSVSKAPSVCTGSEISGLCNVFCCKCCRPSRFNRNAWLEDE